MATDDTDLRRVAAADAPSAANSAPDDAWRERLLASLRDCDVQRAPRAPQLQWLITMIVVAVIAAIVVIGRHAIAVNLRQARVSDWVVRAIDIVWILFVIFVLARIR